jgi:hypothetical protein
MYGRKITLKNTNPDDFETLRQFVHSVGQHSMHIPILKDLLQIPSFIKKSHTIEDSKDGQSFVSLIIFNDKETADKYFNYEGVDAIWEWLKISAEAEGLTVVDDYYGEL